jgi:enediyne biosynthesis protein E4
MAKLEATSACEAALPRVLVVTFLACVLVACSGGGGDDEAQSAQPPSASPPPASPPGPQFSNITNSTGIRFVHRIVNATNSKVELLAGGAAVGDYDDDGDVDLYVVRGNSGPNLLYRNDGGNRFTDVAASAGAARANPAGGGYLQSGPVFVDVDGDADLDLFIGGLEGDPSALLANNGNGTFSDVTAQSGLASMTAKNTISASFADYDLDGDLDMALAHWGTPRPPDGMGGNGDTETLWRNDSNAGGIRLTNVSRESRVAAAMVPRRGGYGAFQPNALDYDYSFVPLFARIDADRYPDLLVVSDFNNTRFFLSNGAQPAPVTFRDATDNAVIIDRNGMGSAVGDVDNDGDLDWLVTGIFGASETVGNRLYRNEGNGLLQDVTVAARLEDGGWGWGACFADFNLDGRLDIFHTNGWENLNPIDNFQSDRSRLFIAQPNGFQFRDEAATRGMTDTEQGRAVICADFDGDGDVDIFMTNRGLENSGAFWLNNDATNQNKALTAKLVGAAPNTQAAGARIRVTVGGVTQTREIAVGNNFTSQTPVAQVFGLGTSAAADSVEIEWPDGSTDKYSNVAAGAATFHQ